MVKRQSQSNLKAKYFCMSTVQHNFCSLCGKNIHNKAPSIASSPDMIPYLFFFDEIWQLPCIKKRGTNKVKIQESAAAEKTNRNTEKKKVLNY
jgi:hypothetical protein